MASGDVVCGIRIGIPTDALIRLPGRSRRDVVAFPEVVATDSRGKLIAWWSFADCRVLIKYSRKRYRVAAVEEVQNAGGS